MAEFIKKLYRNQGIRYIFFGGCTTFVNLGSYALLRTVLGVDMTLANVLAIFLSILFAYAVNKQFVFGNAARMECGNWLWKWGSFYRNASLYDVYRSVRRCFSELSVWHSGSGFQAGTSGGCAGAELYFAAKCLYSRKREGTGKSGKRNCCILGFAIPALTIALAFCSQSVFPFGDHGVLIIDSLHQYLPFFYGIP